MMTLTRSSFAYGVQHRHRVGRRVMEEPTVAGRDRIVELSDVALCTQLALAPAGSRKPLNLVSRSHALGPAYSPAYQKVGKVST